MHCVSPRFSRVVESAPDASKCEALCRPFSLVSGQPVSEAVQKRRCVGFSVVCDGRQKEKRTLPGAFADVSRLVCVATCPTSCEVVVVSSSWSRNFDLVPFRSGEILDNAAKHCLDSHRLEEQKLPHVSGPTDPCPNAVHMEPFSTSVFK